MITIFILSIFLLIFCCKLSGNLTSLVNIEGIVLFGHIVYILINLLFYSIIILYVGMFIYNIFILN